MIPFAAVVTNLFFIRSKYNFWEHFLANTYLAAQLNIMWIVMHFVGFIAALVTGKDVDFAPEFFLTLFLMFFLYPVSYTHLDVYKRQEKSPFIHNKFFWVK